MKLAWVLLLTWVGAARAQSDLPTELDDCTGPGADFCFDGSVALIDAGCGVTFEGYQGRVVWPALRNVGPVTIAVQTRSTGFQGQTLLPLYVEVRREHAPTECDTGRTGRVALVAPGAEQCGGAWSSVGPLDLTGFDVPIGAAYSVQCVFFRTSEGVSIRTVGFSCIRVTSTPNAATPVAWATLKRLYQ